MATVEAILATFKDFVEAPEGQDIYVARADAQLASTDYFGIDDDERNWGVAYLAAHQMVLAGMGSATQQSGLVSSRHIGELSVTYATPRGGGYSVGDYSLTPYGRLYEEWLASHVMAPMTSLG